MKSFARMLILRPGLRFLAVEQGEPHRLWNLPGGKIEVNEAPRAAVVREVFEETGLMCNPRFVRQLCKKKLELGNSVWLGHFFMYYGPLFAMEIQEPEKIVSLRWLHVEEARCLHAHQDVFTGIVDFALMKFTVAMDPWIGMRCLERSNFSKKLTWEEELISLA